MSRFRPSSRRAVIGALAGAAVWAASPVLAQQSGGIAVVDQERVFRDSAIGRALLEELDQRAVALTAENRQIEAALTEEERALTEARATLDMQDFRARAEAFDQKVRQIRAEQDAKANALAQMQDRARQDFVRRVTPVLTALLDETGATVLLDRRVILANDPAADITDRAIARINAEIDGAGQPPGPEGNSPPATPSDPAPEGAQ